MESTYTAKRSCQLVPCHMPKTVPGLYCVEFTVVLKLSESKTFCLHLMFCNKPKCCWGRTYYPHNLHVLLGQLVPAWLPPP